MNKERMNTKSDELQTSVMNCIGCGKVYKSNVMSAYCEECLNKNKNEKRLKLIEQIASLDDKLAESEGFYGKVSLRVSLQRTIQELKRTVQENE